MAWYMWLLSQFWDLVVLWLRTIFITPFENMEMLWLLVPIWLAWFFAEFFQEKTGTSRGNAMSNAIVIVWGSIDCTRQTVSLIASGKLTSLGGIILRFSLIGVIFLYGAWIIWLGLRGSHIIKYVGRVREVTYVFAMFAPVLYAATPLSFQHFIAAVLFFPVFYYAIELVDRRLPNPKAVEEDMREGGRAGGF